jgi:hypothetical protein
LGAIALLVADLGSATAREMVIPPAVYPKLPPQAASAEAFVPPGWKLETKVVGDLNRDGVPDLVLVLREDNPKNLVEHDILGDNPLNTNPRILAIAFGSKAGPYTLQLQNHTLIPRREVPTVEDPLEEGNVAIDRDVLRLKLDYFMSAGSWSAFNVTFRFRHQNGRHLLIGFDRYSFHRGSGESTDVSINFLTGKIRTATGDMANADKKVRWTTLQNRTLLTMEQIGNGLEFDPNRRRAR